MKRFLKISFYNEAPRVMQIHIASTLTRVWIDAIAETKLPYKSTLYFAQSFFPLTLQSGHRTSLKLFFYYSVVLHVILIWNFNNLPYHLLCIALEAHVRNNGAIVEVNLWI